MARNRATFKGAGLKSSNGILHLNFENLPSLSAESCLLNRADPGAPQGSVYQSRLHFFLPPPLSPLGSDRFQLLPLSGTGITLVS